MSIQELKQASKTIWNDIKVAKSILKKSTAVQVSSKSEIETYGTLSARWFELFSKELIHFGVSAEIIEKYDKLFRGVLKLTGSNSRRSSYVKLFNDISSGFNDDIVLFLQTDAVEKGSPDRQQFEEEVKTILDKVSDADENKYLAEALGCWKNGYLKGATILIWCAAIDRIHKVIEQIGFSKFNNISSQMKAQTSGRFKKFKKEFSVQTISEMRSTVFDNDLLWILEGMQLIDANQRTRLASCFDMRCHSGHPGEAPITKYNVLSCFSDIVEIVLANPTFEIKK